MTTMTTWKQPVKVPAIDTYREALGQLRIAADALDQAHSMLRDINLHHLGTGSGVYFVSIANMANRADKLITNLMEETCEECGKAFSLSPDCLEGPCRQTETKEEETDG
jgi:hypothetical protein